MSETAYLLLGSNLGDRLAVFSNALDKIRLKAGDVVSGSLARMSYVVYCAFRFHAR